MCGSIATGAVCDEPIPLDSRIDTICQLLNAILATYGGCTGLKQTVPS
jgi:hypothetical protein